MTRSTIPSACCSHVFGPSLPRPATSRPSPDGCSTSWHGRPGPFLAAHNIFFARAGRGPEPRLIIRTFRTSGHLDRRTSGHLGHLDNRTSGQHDTRPSAHQDTRPSGRQPCPAVPEHEHLYIVRILRPAPCSGEPRGLTWSDARCSWSSMSGYSRDLWTGCLPVAMTLFSGSGSGERWTRIMMLEGKEPTVVVEPRPLKSAPTIRETKSHQEAGEHMFPTQAL